MVRIVQSLPRERLYLLNSQPCRKFSEKSGMSNNEDTLISKLIEETCTESGERDQDTSFVDLRKYFEKRLNEVDFVSISDYMDQHHLSHQVLSYQRNSSCYRLLFKQSVLDFPSNWSVFGHIQNEDLIYIDPTSDDDFLLDIFSELCGSFQNIVLVRDNKEVQLVFLPEESAVTHVKWMKGYFNKKMTSEKQAA